MCSAASRAEFTCERRVLRDVWCRVHLRTSRPVLFRLPFQITPGAGGSGLSLPVFCYLRGFPAGASLAVWRNAAPAEVKRSRATFRNGPSMFCRRSNGHSCGEVTPIRLHQNHEHGLFVGSVALFVFLAAAAGTQIIPPDFGVEVANGLHRRSWSPWFDSMVFFTRPAGLIFFGR